MPRQSKQLAVVFRETFNRDDNNDVNAGVASAKHWLSVKLHSDFPDAIRPELATTAIKMTAPARGLNVKGLLQPTLSSERGIIRYATHVSLDLGEGSQARSGMQEAGIVLLADPSEASEFKSTFVGILFDSRRQETMGSLIYTVGDGDDGYRSRVELTDKTLPFKITEGEYEIIVEHDPAKNVLKRVRINGSDITYRFSPWDLTQKVRRGRFGIRSAIDNMNHRVRLRQFYWHYRVEQLG